MFLSKLFARSDIFTRAANEVTETEVFKVKSKMGAFYILYFIIPQDTLDARRMSHGLRKGDVGGT